MYMWQALASAFVAMPRLAAPLLVDPVTTIDETIARDSCWMATKDLSATITEVMKTIHPQESGGL